MEQRETSPRLAEAADLDTVRQLTEAAYAPYTTLLGEPPKPVTENYGPRIARGEVWLAYAAGEVVGLLVLERHPDHALIYSVAVTPARQGEGHGLRLLRFAEDTARAWGAAEVRLYTNARMERNIALYAAVGYRETGRRPHTRRPGVVLVDMAKPIV